jgi:hypothetical protein
MLLMELLVFFTMVMLAASRSVQRDNDVFATCPWAVAGGHLYTSYWKELLESGRFRPALEAGGHHVTRLRHQLLELRTAVEFYRDPFTWVHFGKLFQQTDTELSAVR